MQKNPLIEIGILLYPNARMAAVPGLTDLFVLAQQMAAAGGPGAFRRVFTRLVGLTPSDYRRRFNAEQLNGPN